MFNPQQQTKVTWPATPVVARAYLDQLTRSKALPAERVAAVKAALTRADKAKSGKDAAAAKELETLAGQLQQAHAERRRRQARRRTGVDAHGDRRGAAVSGSRVADGAAVKRWQPSAHAPRVCASETAPQAGKTRLRLSVR